MRIVSMVPSWTETLIECGADVVGRTRFCIHPSDKVKAIPAIGGTKDWDLEKIKALKPDLLILDQDENPKFMGDQAPCAFHATHITSMSSVAPELEAIAKRIRAMNDHRVADALKSLSQRWKTVSAKSLGLTRTSTLPGVMEWITPAPKTNLEAQKIVYVIWKNPWMAAGRDTFIGSVLTHLGIKAEAIWSGEAGCDRYPEFTLEHMPSDVLFLFSSEPYPFGKKKSEISSLARPAALVDGECFSWFGLRSLKFLESI